MRPVGSADVNGRRVGVRFPDVHGFARELVRQVRSTA